MFCKKIVNKEFLGIRMELEDIEGNLFNAFFGAAYSVIIFGPIILPLTNDNFINGENFISIALLYGILIVSFWMLVKNSMDWSTEEITAVETNSSKLFDLVSILKEKNEIKQISLFIYILIPGAVFHTGLLTMHQVFVWLFTITIILSLQFYESRKVLKYTKGI